MQKVKSKVNVKVGIKETEWRKVMESDGKLTETVTIMVTVTMITVTVMVWLLFKYNGNEQMSIT